MKFPRTQVKFSKKLNERDSLRVGDNSGEIKSSQNN